MKYVPKQAFDCVFRSQKGWWGAWYGDRQVIQNQQNCKKKSTKLKHGRDQIINADNSISNDNF